MAETEDLNIQPVPELPQSAPTEYEVREMMRQKQTQRMQGVGADARDPALFKRAADNYGTLLFTRITLHVLNRIGGTDPLGFFGPVVMRESGVV